MLDKGSAADQLRQPGGGRAAGRRHAWTKLEQQWLAQTGAHPSCSDISRARGVGGRGRERQEAASGRRQATRAHGHRPAWTTSGDPAPVPGPPVDDDQLSAHPAWFPSPLQRERDAYRRGRARRSIVIAAVSTVVFLTAVVYAVDLVARLAAGAGLVLRPRGRSRRAASGPARALAEHLRAGSSAAVVMLVLRPAPGDRCARCAGRSSCPVRALATAYVDLFRGLPLIIVLYLVGFGAAGPAAAGRADGRRSCWAPSR